jgi:hypothetical protein
MIRMVRLDRELMQLGSIGRTELAVTKGTSC